MQFENEREREVYESELEQCGGMVRWKAERCAEHAVKLHRELVTHKRCGCGEDGRPLEKQGHGPRKPPIRGDVAAIVAGLLTEAEGFFGPQPSARGYTKRSHHTVAWRWYAMTALYEAFGSSRASLAMDITEVGLRGADRKLKIRHPEAHAAAVATGRRLAEEQKGRAA